MDAHGLFDNADSSSIVGIRLCFFSFCNLRMTGDWGRSWDGRRAESSGFEVMPFAGNPSSESVVDSSVSIFSTSAPFGGFSKNSCSNCWASDAAAFRS